MINSYINLCIENPFLYILFSRTKFLLNTALYQPSCTVKIPHLSLLPPTSVKIYFFGTYLYQKADILLSHQQEVGYLQYRYLVLLDRIPTKILMTFIVIIFGGRDEEKEDDSSLLHMLHLAHSPPNPH